MLITGLCLPVSGRALPLIASSGNPSNDKLLDMPEKGQAAMLSKATHYACLGKDPFYVGTETHGVNRGVSFWSITCENNGKKFMVIIAPDAIGSTKIFECNLLHNRPWQCYAKLKE
jgi:hypothetical protein